MQKELLNYKEGKMRYRNLLLISLFVVCSLFLNFSKVSAHSCGVPTIHSVSSTRISQNYLNIRVKYGPTGNAYGYWDIIQLHYKIKGKTGYATPENDNWNGLIGGMVTLNGHQCYNIGYGRYACNAEVSSAHDIEFRNVKVNNVKLCTSSGSGGWVNPFLPGSSPVSSAACSSYSTDQISLEVSAYTTDCIDCQDLYGFNCNEYCGSDRCSIDNYRYKDVPIPSSSPTPTPTYTMPPPPVPNEFRVKTGCSSCGTQRDVIYFDQVSGADRYQIRVYEDSDGDGVKDWKKIIYNGPYLVDQGWEPKSSGQFRYWRDDNEVRHYKMYAHKSSGSWVNYVGVPSYSSSLDCDILPGEGEAFTLTKDYDKCLATGTREIAFHWNSLSQVDSYLSTVRYYSTSGFRPSYVYDRIVHSASVLNRVASISQEDSGSDVTISVAARNQCGQRGVAEDIGSNECTVSDEKVFQVGFMANSINIESSEDSGLILENDPNVINNPPPGFTDLIKPSWLELVP